MSAPQGVMDFSGIANCANAFIAGDFSLKQSISPGIATLFLAPNVSFKSKHGTLRISYGGKVLNFNNATIADLHAETGSDGKQVIVVQILDRRWRWRDFGRIRGEYNIHPTDKRDKIKREKTPRELAAMCFKAMGETGFDVSALPVDSRPYVLWDGPPAIALQEICDECGCRVVLRINGKAAIVRLGVGQSLPDGFDVEADSFAYDPPEMPGEFVFLAGNTQWQADLELEAVGLDNDGKIKLIKDLSYKPKYGGPPFGLESPPRFPGILKVTDRLLAEESIFRMYRIKTPFTFGKEKVDDLERILPIEQQLLETTTVLGKSERKPAVVYGAFDNNGESYRASTAKTVWLNGVQHAQYPGSFAIDEVHGLVRFSDPVTMFGDENGFPLTGTFSSGLVTRTGVTGALTRIPADIRLRTTVSLRDKDTWAFSRHEVRKKPTAGAGGPAFYVAREDISRKLFYIHSASVRKDNDNLTELKKQADFYIAQAMLEFQSRNPGTRTYAGMRAIDVDGLIQEVSWQISNSGEFRTTVSRGRDDNPLVSSYQEMVEKAKLRDLLRKQSEADKRRPRRA